MPSSSAGGGLDPRPDPARIRDLVQEALGSGRTLAEICRDCPELLPDVRALVEKARALELELDVLFPPSEPP
jgi:hypothetical protein